MIVLPWIGYTARIDDYQVILSLQHRYMGMAEAYDIRTSGTGSRFYRLIPHIYTMVVSMGNPHFIPSDIKLQLSGQIRKKTRL